MYQKVIIAGNLGRDPELRYTPQGSPVVNFPVAVNRKRDGEDVATWFKVTCWGSLGEACNQHLSKGRQVLVEGELRADPETGAPRVWQRNDGTWGASFEVTARTVTFLSGRRSEDELYEEPEPQQEELPF